MYNTTSFHKQLSRISIASLVIFLTSYKAKGCFWKETGKHFPLFPQISQLPGLYEHFTLRSYLFWVHDKFRRPTCCFGSRRVASRDVGWRHLHFRGTSHVNVTSVATRSAWSRECVVQIFGLIERQVIRIRFESIENNFP